MHPTATMMKYGARDEYSSWYVNFYFYFLCLPNISQNSLWPTIYTTSESPQNGMKRAQMTVCNTSFSTHHYPFWPLPAVSSYRWSRYFFRNYPFFFFMIWVIDSPTITHFTVPSLVWTTTTVWRMTVHDGSLFINPHRSFSGPTASFHPFWAPAARFQPLPPFLSLLQPFSAYYKVYKDFLPIQFTYNYSMNIVLYFRKCRPFHSNTLRLYSPSNGQNMGNKIIEMPNTWLKVDFSCIQGLHRFYTNTRPT